MKSKRKANSKEPDSRTSDPDIKNALGKTGGELYTLQTDSGTLIIGDAGPLPTADKEEDDEDYPDVPNHKGDYDTWLG